MTIRIQLAVAATVLAVASGASDVSASGFEKSVPFSGEIGGIVGAGASLNSGAESLFFQPSALSQAPTGKLSFDLNFSPTLLQSKGDFNVAPGITTGATVPDDVAVDSGSEFSPFFGVFASYGITEKLGLGAGAYVAGGSNIEITGVEAVEGALFDDGRLISELTIIETSLGLGYEIVDGLEIGAAYRLAFVSGQFSALQASDGGVLGVAALTQLDFNDLQDTRHAYRVGLRYAPKNAAYGIGVSYRSGIDFEADATVSGKVQTSNAAVPGIGAICTAAACGIASNDATLASTFPEQVNIGAFVDVAKDLRTVLEFSLTRYAVNQRIDLTGDLELDEDTAAPGTNIGDLADSPIALGWRNQLAGKIGFIFTGVDNWAFRLGYSHVSQVVPAEHSRPTFTAPGPANYFSIGAGTTFGSIGVNAAYEYTALSGEGDFQAQGELTQNAHALHLGVSLSI